MTLLAAFQALLRHYTGQDDVAVGTPVEGCAGSSGNLLVLRGDLSGDPSFRQLLGRTRDLVAAAWEHRDLPFERLAQELEPERDPLVRVLFALRESPGPARELAAVAAGTVGFFAGRSSTQTLTGSGVGAVVRARSIERGFDLSLTLEEEEDGRGLHCAPEYDPELFDAVTIRRLAGHFRTLLAGIADDPERRLSQLWPAPAAEEQLLLREWNDTAVAAAASEYPRQTLSRLFEAQVERTPEAVAVALGDEWLSYRELNLRANRLAHRLRALEVGPEVAVGIFLDRSPAMVMAVLAVLKAGGFYVPLDPSYPRERLRTMLEDSEAGWVLTREELVAELPASAARPLCLEAAGPGREENPAAGSSAGNLAYLLYTSGSTGRPKGVACSPVGGIDL
ncbi:MAG: AMP-binding protein, partial [bacterium]|nr:AMP-binding protein [bacterium]